MTTKEDAAKAEKAEAAAEKKADAAAEKARVDYPPILPSSPTYQDGRGLAYPAVSAPVLNPDGTVRATSLAYPDGLALPFAPGTAPAITQVPPISPRPATAKDLLTRLRELAVYPAAERHQRACDLLLAFVNDADVSAAFSAHPRNM